MFNYIVLLFALVGLAACEQESVGASSDQTADKAVAAGNTSPGKFEGTVLQSIDSAGYTYVLLDTDRGEVWLAGPQTPVETGDTVAAGGGMYMGTYHSNSLDRDFENLYFVSTLQKGGMTARAPSMPESHPPAEAAEVAVGSPDEIEPAEGGKRIAEIFADREALAGEQVTVKGKVVKFNSGIMGTNWVHLQDGTGDAESRTSDLTVTTDDVVRVGDIVTMSGKVTVDKDFGAGYRYNVIVEEASVVNPEG